MDAASSDQHQPSKPVSGPWTPYEPGGDDPDFFFPATYLDRVTFLDRVRRVFGRQQGTPNHD